MCLLRIHLPNLCPNMNHFDGVDFSECHSEEVMFLLTLSLYWTPRGGCGSGTLPYISVSSFLVWAGGGGGAYLVACDRKNIMYCNLYARASASEAYRPIFSGLKIHLHTYTINAVPFCYLWYGAINDSIGQNTLTLRKIYDYVSERGASELGNFSHFHILKTAIFLQYSVGTSDTLSQKKYTSISGPGVQGVQTPPPPFEFFFSHPGGRSGRTVPLPNNVNDAQKKTKKCVGVRVRVLWKYNLLLSFNR